MKLLDDICTCGHRSDEHREKDPMGILTRRICLDEDCNCMELQVSTLESIERAKKMRRPKQPQGRWMGFAK